MKSANEIAGEMRTALREQLLLESKLTAVDDARKALAEQLGAARTRYYELRCEIEQLVLATV